MAVISFVCQSTTVDSHLLPNMAALLQLKMLPCSGIKRRVPITLHPPACLAMTPTRQSKASTLLAFCTRKKAAKELVQPQLIRHADYAWHILCYQERSVIFYLFLSRFEPCFVNHEISHHADGNFA